MHNHFPTFASRERGGKKTEPQSSLNCKNVRERIVKVKKKGW
jgi:hypothetical protein